MEVTDPICTFLTNREVLSVLQESKSSKQKHMRKHNTIVYETTNFLKSTPAASQNEEDAKRLMSDLENLFHLTSAEILQVINLRPTSNVELAMILEECEERFSDEKLEEMLALITLGLPKKMDGAE
ncbi:DNA-directed RNA polymerase III subunit RPC9 [Aphelenchoides bicaudatus]|nr:DNA-directed RNA polymerase III subunit RPC9 [Aphelenchoides bicaudatus]